MRNLQKLRLDEMAIDDAATIFYHYLDGRIEYYREKEGWCNYFPGLVLNKAGIYRVSSKLRVA